jgi:hypothetical protein
VVEARDFQLYPANRRWLPVHCAKHSVQMGLEDIRALTGGMSRAGVYRIVVRDKPYPAAAHHAYRCDEQPDPPLCLDESRRRGRTCSARPIRQYQRKESLVWVSCLLCLLIITVLRPCDILT